MTQKQDSARLVFLKPYAFPFRAWRWCLILLPATVQCIPRAVVLANGNEECRSVEKWRDSARFPTPFATLRVIVNINQELREICRRGNRVDERFPDSIKVFK